MSDATLRLAPGSSAWFRGLRGAPSVSAQSALVMVALVVGLTASGASLLVDPDTQWHIAVGRQIWTAVAVPTTDLYSHTFQGAPWIAKEWLSQLILFGAYELGAWRAVVLVTALAVGITFAVLHEWLLRRMHPLAALCLTLVGLLLARSHLLARPHILVLPLVVAWMIGLATAVERDRPPPLALALVMALWANMHGSFPLGLAMAGLLAIEGVVAAPRPRRAARLRGWALFLATATAATAVSPYGWRAILVPLQMEGNSETLKYVAEWKRLGLDVMGVTALLSLAACIAILLRGWRANLLRLAAVAALGVMMVRHVRFISLFGVLAPVLIARAVGRLPGLSPRPSEPQPALWGVAGALALGLPVALLLAAPTPAASVTPNAAYQAAVAAGVEGPVYNTYDFGGFLIAHGVKTFVDGRTDQLFLGDFLPNLMHALDSDRNDAFAALLARYHVTWALVRTGSRDAAHLAWMPGWSRVHSDEVATTFVHDR